MEVPCYARETDSELHCRPERLSGLAMMAPVPFPQLAMRSITCGGGASGNMAKRFAKSPMIHSAVGRMCIVCSEMFCAPMTSK